MVTMDFSALPSLSTPVREVARTDFVRLLASETVKGAIRRLRSERIGERIIYFYVTDEDGRLVGVVPTRRLLLSEPEKLVGEVMVAPVVSVHEDEPLRAALNLLTAKRYLALPVVDSQGRLTGVIDVAGYSQDIIDLERREQAEELFQLAGIHIEQERGRGSLWVVRHRFPWLLSNIFSGLIAAYISGLYRDLLDTIVALAFFVPLVLALAESICVQSVTVSLSQLQVIRQSAASGGVFREMRTGLLLGLGSALLVGVFGAVWLRAYTVAIVVAGGIALAGLIGATIGYLVPRAVHRWRLDPTIASGPAGLAITDIVTITAYFSLAAIVLTY